MNKNQQMRKMNFGSVVAKEKKIVHDYAENVNIDKLSLGIFYE